MAVVFCGTFDWDLATELAGVRHQLVQDLAAVETTLSSPDREPSLLFLRDQVLKSQFEKLQNLLKLNPRLKMVIVYDEIDSTELIPWLKTVSSVSHIVPMKSENSLQFVKKMVANEHPPPELFCPTQFEERHEETLDNSKKCGDVYKGLSEFIGQKNCFSGFDSIVQTAASELLTNAFYNGKRDPKTGQPVVEDRTAIVKLPPEEAISVVYGVSSGYFWLVVRDRFGSLDRPILVNALTRAAVERRPRMDSPGGAGLGLMMLYNWSTEFNVFFSPGRWTLIACKFFLTRRNAEFERQRSALHILNGSVQPPQAFL